MKLIRFTRPDNRFIWINPEQVQSVTNTGPTHPNAKTLINLVSGEQAVKEELESVVNVLRSLCP
jgi:hypothetical protein